MRMRKPYLEDIKWKTIKQNKQGTQTELPSNY